MKFKQGLHRLSAGGVLAIVIMSGVCGGLFSMPRTVRAVSQAATVMEQCQGTINHQHRYSGPTLAVNHGAAQPADCCISHARYYQTFLKTSDGQKIFWTAAVAPAIVSLAAVNFSEPPVYQMEIFPPPAQVALASVIKRE